jgi:hypothetical protein
VRIWKGDCGTLSPENSKLQGIKEKAQKGSWNRKDAGRKIEDL